MKLSDFKLNTIECANQEGLYFEHPKTKLEKTWDNLRLIYATEQKNESNSEKFMSFLNLASAELANNLLVYSDCHQIPAENPPENKISLKIKIIDELACITNKALINFQKAIDDKRHVWNKVIPYKHLGLNIINNSVSIGSPKYFIDLDHLDKINHKVDDTYNDNKVDYTYKNYKIDKIDKDNNDDKDNKVGNVYNVDNDDNKNKDDKIDKYNNDDKDNKDLKKNFNKNDNFNNTFNDNDSSIKIDEIICEVSLFNFKSKFSSKEFQRKKFENSKIEKHLNFLKIKEKCMIFSNGDLIVKIFVNDNKEDKNFFNEENNNNFDKEDKNFFNDEDKNDFDKKNNLIIINDNKVARFVFESIINNIKISEFVDKIYNLIIATIASKKGSTPKFLEYENDFYFINEDVYRIKQLHGKFVIYKNEIEIKRF
ncbi:hypothetical protein DMUE_0595 [Dictyocoela muelleri]|nr:hypothetical protein DMUE_0595 [Dictyocoela muelleri]